MAEPLARDARRPVHLELRLPLRPELLVLGSLLSRRGSRRRLLRRELEAATVCVRDGSVVGTRDGSVVAGLTITSSLSSALRPRPRPRLPPLLALAPRPAAGVGPPSLRRSARDLPEKVLVCIMVLRSTV